MYKPTICECIEGSYKEGYELEWQLVDNVVEINLQSLKRPWNFCREGIETNIYRDLAKYYPNVTLRWI